MCVILWMEEKKLRRKKKNLLDGTSLMVADSGVDLGVQASHDVVGRGLLGNNAALGLQPHIVRLIIKITRTKISCISINMCKIKNTIFVPFRCTYRNVTSQNGERRFGNGGDVGEQVLTQLRRRVAVVVAPRGGAAVGDRGRVGVLAATQRLVASGLRALDVLSIDVPARNFQSGHSWLDVGSPLSISSGQGV